MCLDGYLVIARCENDDIPIGFYDTYEEALEHRFDPPNRAIREQFATTATEYICVHIVVFEDGVPIKNLAWTPCVDTPVEVCEGLGWNQGREWQDEDECLENANSQPSREEQLAAGDHQHHEG